MSESPQKDARKPHEAVHGDDSSGDVSMIKKTPPESHSVVSATLGCLKRVMIKLTKLSIVFVVVVAVMFAASNTLSYYKSLAVQRLCTIPLASVISICTRLPDIMQEPRYSDLVDLQLKIEPIVKTVGYGSSLAGDLLKTEMAAEDLMPFVDRLELESKQELIRELSGFVASAHTASVQLSVLDAAVTHTVDSIIGMDNYAVKTLERMAKQGSGSIVLKKIPPFNEQDIESRKKLIRVFNRAMDLFQDDIAHLISISSATMEPLHRLRYHLTGIHKLVTTEKVDFKAREDKVLADLWTYVGGSKLERQATAKNLAVLETVDQYLLRAATQVGDNLTILQNLQASLKELRRKAGLLASADEEDTPLEMHIEALRKGVARLSEEKSKAEERHDAVIRRKMGLGLKEMA